MGSCLGSRVAGKAPVLWVWPQQRALLLWVEDQSGHRAVAFEEEETLEAWDSGRKVDEEGGSCVWKIGSFFHLWSLEEY